MKWIKASELKVIDPSREYIGKWKKLFVNNGNFTSDGGKFIFDMYDPPIDASGFDELFILQKDEEVSPAPVSVNPDDEKAAEAYGDGFYKVLPYDHYESDYDYRTQVAKNKQVQEHFLAGCTYKAQTTYTREHIDLVIISIKERMIDVSSMVDNYIRHKAEGFNNGIEAAIKIINQKL